MNKFLTVVSVFLVLGVSGYGEGGNSETTVKAMDTNRKQVEETEKETGWWHEIGDQDSDYWWVAEYADE